MKIEIISKKFRENLVLRDISLNLERGSIIGLVGKNGAGKTTLMKIICGNIVHYEGEIESSSNESNIGFLIEHPKFYPNSTGLYNLNYFSEVSMKKIDKKYIEYIISSLGMNDYINRKVKTYSLGMKQRLGIAISLLKKPQYLILDEPTNGMDPEGSLEVLNIIKKLGKQFNMSILISSHKLEDIEMISDKIIYIENGIIKRNIDTKQLVQSGIVEILLSTNEVQTVYSLIKNEVKIISVEEQSIKIEYIDDYSFILEKLAKHNIFPKSIEKHTRTLKDFYFNLSEKRREIK